MWVNTQRNQVSGQIVSPAAPTRSYIIDVPTGQVSVNIIPQPLNNDEPPLHDTEINTVIILPMQNQEFK